MQVTSMYDVYLEVKEALENQDIIDYGFLTRDSLCVFDGAFDENKFFEFLKFVLSSMECIVLLDKCSDNFKELYSIGKAFYIKFFFLDLG